MNHIAIHSVPRSGSTWLGSIFDSHPRVAYRFQPLFSYAFKGRLNPHSTKEDINSFYQEVLHSEDAFIHQTLDKDRGIVPSFAKEEIHSVAYKEVRYHHILPNLLQQDLSVKVVGLVRNPLSTLYSWLNAPKEFKPDLGWTVEDEWQWAPLKNDGKPEEFNGYEKWKEVVYLFLRLKEQYPNRFYLLNYSDLLSEPVLVVHKLFDFMKLDFAVQTMQFLQESRSRNVQNSYGVFKTRQRDDVWINHLPAYITDHVQQELNGTPLQIYLDNV